MPVLVLMLILVIGCNDGDAGCVLTARQFMCCVDMCVKRASSSDNHHHK